MYKNLKEALKAHSGSFAHVTPFDFKTHSYYVFDFTKQNEALAEVDLNDELAFTNFVFQTLRNHDSNVGVGGYGEHRFIYSRSEVFSGEENRSIHLGIDIWAEAGTPIYCPLDGTVHSFKNNNNHGDYGPTILLAHELEGFKFHTLYGHLSLSSIESLQVGDTIKKGKEFAWFGAYHENVHWPPHLHFQVIEDMGAFMGDYPGVAKPSEKEQWLANCPDPNLILGVPTL